MLTKQINPNLFFLVEGVVLTEILILITESFIIALFVFNLMRKTLKQHFVNFISQILCSKYLENKEEANKKIGSIQIYVTTTLNMNTSENEGTIHFFSEETF